MTYELVTAHTNLKALATPAEPYDFTKHTPDSTLQLAKDMLIALEKYKGLGISSNQIGLPWAVFAMRGEPGVFFNPRIAMPGDEIVKLEEACLSFAGMVIPMKRPKTIRVRYATPDGNMTSHTYSGMTARIFQHEMCHLEGKMWFEGCNRHHLERAIRQAKHRGYDYTHMGLMKYAG